MACATDDGRSVPVPQRRLHVCIDAGRTILRSGVQFTDDGDGAAIAPRERAMREHRQHSRVTVVVLAAVLAAFAAAPASAAAPKAVEIVSPMTFAPPGEFNFGTFEASGPAVDDGLICESGDVNDTGIMIAGGQSRAGKIQIPVYKTFTCPDGELFIRIQVHLDLETFTETFSWVVLGGTGAYADVRGSGRGFSFSQNPDVGNVNVYSGFLVG